MRLSGSGAEGSKGTNSVLMCVDARPRPYPVEAILPCQRLQERPIIAVVRESIAYSSKGQIPASYQCMG